MAWTIPGAWHRAVVGVFGVCCGRCLEPIEAVLGLGIEVTDGCNDQTPVLVDH